MAILKALADNGAGVHHVMDPFQAKFDDVGLAMVARAGLDPRLQFHRKFAEEVIPSLPPLQFGFIDSSHLFDLTICEFVLMDKKLEVGGLLAFHDLWMPSLQAFTRYVLANRAYEIVRDFHAPEDHSRPSFRTRLKWSAQSLLQWLPGSERILSQEVLKPWSKMGLSNLLILQKTGQDTRDWRFHAPF